MESKLTLPWHIKSKEVTELKLVKKAIKGDSDAYTELIKLHKEYLYKIAYSYVKNEQKALDILQECTYKGLLNISKLNNAKFFKTWITRVLINVAINYNKKEENIVYLDETLEPTYDKKSISIEEKLDLYDAIDVLRENYKMVIILKYFNDMTIEEIAIIMDIPVNTVKSNLRRSKEELRQLLMEVDFYE